VTVPLLAPGSQYLDRLRQLDLRVARTFTAGQRRFKAMIDFYNTFNASTVVIANDTYGTNGASWLQPLQILQARYAKLGVQIDF
jgi:hypothetical protein